jgi:hypothetical protein
MQNNLIFSTFSDESFMLSMYNCLNWTIDIKLDTLSVESPLTDLTFSALKSFSGGLDLVFNFWS